MRWLPAVRSKASGRRYGSWVAIVEVGATRGVNGGAADPAAVPSSSSSSSPMAAANWAANALALSGTTEMGRLVPGTIMEGSPPVTSGSVPNSCAAFSVSGDTSSKILSNKVGLLTIRSYRPLQAVLPKANLIVLSHVGRNCLGDMGVLSMLH